MSGSPSTSTTTSNNAPPQQFLDQYTAVNQQANNVANTPYNPYQGNIVAPFAPGQIQGMQQVNDLTANGGVQAPYLDAATRSLLNAQTPLWSNVQQFSPDAVSTYESPYTQQVVDATQAQFNNANAIQQQQVIGDAISKGAFGGDREAVAQAITAGQQQLAQAPVLAGLRNQGYSQALGEFNNQQAAQLGANEANAWLGSQAGSLFGNLGNEAQQLGLQGAQAQMGVGGMQQGMGQSLLNIPYEQYLASQAYPFQTTGWLANIAEGLGGASGGNSSTTVPGPSTTSQLAGLGLGAAGIAGQAGAFKGLGNSISNAFSSANSVPAAGTDAYAAYLNTGAARGGMVPARAPGGSVPDVSLSVIPQATGLGASPIATPTSPDSIVPGASGMGAAPGTHGSMDILKNYGQTATTVGPKQDSTLGSLIKTAGAIAAGIYGTPAAGIAATELNKQYTLATGGEVPHREVGGMAASAEVPSWARAAASGMDRHGLLASPVAGRTDQLAISPAAGSYVVPADVVSGLGEGNTLAGANIMQRILDTGPHGLKMPVSSHNHMGPPRAPPAYNENTEHISNTPHYVPNARGGKIQKRAVGGYTSLQDFINRGSSPPSTPTPTTDVTTNAGMGINASTGTGTSQTGLPALDNYLNNVVKGAAYRQPAISPAPPTTTGSPNGNSMTNAPPFVQAFANGAPNGGVETNAYWNASPYLQQFANDLAANPQANPQYTTFFQDQANLPNNGGGGMASGGMVPRRADAGYVPGGLGENPGDDVYNLEVTTDPATPPAMEGTPAAVGLAPPGATVGQAAALRANASGIPAAPTRMHDTGEPMAQGSGLHRAQADPWLALAEAGFGMAAGRSPHALENIGAGANEGVKRYIQQKQEANKENLQADIWGGRLGVQQDSNAIKQQRADSLDKVAEARVPLLQAQAAKYTQQAVNGGKPEIFKYAGDNDDGLPIFVGNHGTQKLGDIAIGLTANQRSLEAGREAQHGDRQAALQQKTSQFLQTQQGRDLDRRIRAQLGDNAEAGRVVGRISMLVASGINPEKAEAQVAAETKRAQQRAKPGSASVLIPPTGPSAPIGAPPPSGAPPLSEILGP